jgi:hypothetical protein
MRSTFARLLVLGAGALIALGPLPPDGAVQAAPASCWHRPPAPLDFRFCADSGGWTAGFSDLPAHELEGDFYGLSFRRARIPRLQSSDRLLGLRLSGDNHSDDLFMYVKRQITGLRPHADYVVRLRFTLFSNAGPGCVGIGGAPGESVYVKAGTVPFEPRAVEDQTGDLVMNLDKGNQAQGGSDAIVLGDLATDGADCAGTVYAPKRFAATGPDALVGKADRDGNLWVLIGTDSGFEGRTTYYISSISLTLRQR